MSGFGYRLLIAASIILGAFFGIAGGYLWTSAFAQEADFGSCGTVGNIAESEDTTGYYVCNSTHLWKWSNGSFPRPEEELEIQKYAISGVAGCIVLVVVLLCIAQTMLVL